MHHPVCVCVYIHTILCVCVHTAVCVARPAVQTAPSHHPTCMAKEGGRLPQQGPGPYGALARPVASPGGARTLPPWTGAGPGPTGEGTMLPGHGLVLGVEPGPWQGAGPDPPRGPGPHRLPGAIGQEPRAGPACPGQEKRGWSRIRGGHLSLARPPVPWAGGGWEPGAKPRVPDPPPKPAEFARGGAGRDYSGAPRNSAEPRPL